jgi:hypothetical protein
MRNQKEVRKQVRRLDGIDAEDGYHQGVGGMRNGVTVKKKRDAGAQHVGAGKFRHPRGSSGPIYVDDVFFGSIYVDDGIFRHRHVVILHHARFL